MNLFDIEGRLFQILRIIGNLFLLNLLWLFCSLPLITFGASTTALYSVTLKMVQHKEGNLCADFFRAFKVNFKQSTFLWVVLFFSAILLIFNIRFTSIVTISILANSRYLFYGFAIFYIAIFLYVFPLQAHYQNSIFSTLKNAIILALHSLPYTLFMLLVGVFVWIFLRVFPALIFPLVFMGGSCIAYCFSTFFIKIFKNLTNK